MFNPLQACEPMIYSMYVGILSMNCLIFLVVRVFLEHSCLFYTHTDLDLHYPRLDLMHCLPSTLDGYGMVEYLRRSVTTVEKG